MTAASRAAPPGVPPALVAADLDGTLLGRDLSWAAGLPEALAALRAAGVRTVICTGRMLAERAARGRAPRRHRWTGRLLPGRAGRRPRRAASGCGTSPWTGAAAAEVVRHVRADGPAAQRLHRRPAVRGAGDRRGRGATPSTSRSASTRWTTWRPRSSGGRRRSWCWSRRRPTSTRSCPGLQERWRGRLYVVRSQPEYIEFADASVSKSGTLAWLCERLGVARERGRHARRRHERRRHARVGGPRRRRGGGGASRCARRPISSCRAPACPSLLRDLAERAARHISEGGAWRGGAAFEGPRCWWDSTGLRPPDGTRVH